MHLHESIHRTLRPPISTWITAFNAHDATGITALYTDDAELFDSGMKRVRRGRQEIEGWFSNRFKTMPETIYTPVGQLFVEEEHEGMSGDGGQLARVAITWTVQGRTPRFFGQRWIARPFRIDGISIFTLRDDLICQQRGYYDHLAVIEQALPVLRWVVPRL